MLSYKFTRNGCIDIPLQLVGKRRSPTLGIAVNNEVHNFNGTPSKTLCLKDAIKMMQYNLSLDL